MQRQEGLVGTIIVSLPEGESEPFAYDHGHNILLTDWYHKSTADQAIGLSSIPFVFVGEPQVIKWHYILTKHVHIKDKSKLRYIECLQSVLFHVLSVIVDKWKRKVQLLSLGSF